MSEKTKFSNRFQPQKCLSVPLTIESPTELFSYLFSHLNSWGMSDDILHAQALICLSNHHPQWENVGGYPHYFCAPPRPPGTVCLCWRCSAIISLMCYPKDSPAAWMHHNNFTHCSTIEVIKAATGECSCRYGCYDHHSAIHYIVLSQDFTHIHLSIQPAR